MYSRIFAGALLLAVPAAPAMADVDRAFDRDCWEQQEVAAARLQQFKTMLLVGALHCRDVQPYIMADYNHFLRAKRGFINANAQVVRDRFVRKFGPSYGLTAFSDYETSLGNRLAQTDYDSYRCETIGNYARLAAEVSEAGLMDLAYSTDEETQLAVCTPAMRYAGGRWSSRAEIDAPLPPRAEPELAAATTPPPLPPEPVAEPAPPPPAPVAVAAAEWPDLAPVEPETTPVSVDPNKAVEVAVADTTPPVPEATVKPAVAEAPPKANPTEALRAAIKSLTAAVEALEASQTVAATQ